MTRALFILGRGPQAPLIGSLVDIRTGPGPSTLAELRAGWRMLTATRPDDYIAAVGDLLALWRAAGAHVEPRPQDPLPHDLAPYPDGSLPGADHDPPVRPHFGTVYAFDQGPFGSGVPAAGNRSRTSNPPVTNPRRHIPITGTTSKTTRDPPARHRPQRCTSDRPDRQEPHP